MTLSIKVAIAAACAAAAVALVADPAAARVHHHHHPAQARIRHGRAHEMAAESARRHGLRGREAEKTLVSHHVRRHAAPVEVATRTADHPSHRHAALCETVMVHGHWTTRCRGETA
jgi:hypothetical protein